MNTVDPASFDFETIEVQAVERLRDKQVTPVPASLVKLAQLSYDGQKQHDGTVKHVFEYQAESPAAAQAFASLMRHAGDHTVPETSVTAIVDPNRPKDSDEPVNASLVRFRAGAKRGRKSGDVTAEGDTTVE